ncbi:metallophosphoesterase family protein [Deinococcus kurensis]|uniref:metallophosphoesterase family protein n=1 Tax=Deinococcus kurensis TaxID=2662757 RepID=UPI0012D314CA|nr:metallophosphoesterase [Deinococcus kurensis]
MRLLSLQDRPFHRVRFLNAAKRGGTETGHLPFLRGQVDALPGGLDALLLTGDLQGVVRAWTGLRLLGLEVVTACASLAAEGHLPDLRRTGVLLAGDLYAAPGGDVRGASGNATPVWAASAEAFAWVTGVQGNHDTFDPHPDTLERAHLLDVDGVTLSGLHVAGVGGVIGDPARPARRAEADYLAGVALALERLPDVLLLHHSPAMGTAQRGDEALSRVLRASPPPLTVCGHVHWDEPLGHLPGGASVLNVDKRVIILTT